ncbi:MAG: hypothetical protein ACI4MS_07405 [Candidatus Coproplasma sp.]
MKKGKIVASIILSTALIAGACATVGCNKTTDTTSSVASISDRIQTTGDFYSYGAASVGTIISASNGQTASSALAKKVVLNTLTAEGADSTEDGNTDSSTEETDTGVTEDGTDGTTEENTGDTTENTGDNTEGTPEETTPEGGQPNPEQPNPEQPAPELPGQPLPGHPEHNPNQPQAPAEPSYEITEEQLEVINSYMGLVENLLGDDCLNYVISESDREGYEIMETVSYGDLEGNLISYTMYYNRTLLFEDTKNHHGEEETESVYTIEGIMIIDGAEYALEGVSEIESEGNETETEAYFKVTLSEGSYVIMEQEMEDDEQSLVYKIVEDHKVIEETKFEYELEEGETEVKMSVKKDGSIFVLNFNEEIEEGLRVIKVKAQENENRISFKIFITQDEEGNDVYRYVFGEDDVRDMHKNRYENRGHNNHNGMNDGNRFGRM